jgi:hypothetical protein
MMAMTDRFPSPPLSFETEKLKACLKTFLVSHSNAPQYVCIGDCMDLHIGL